MDTERHSTYISVVQKQIDIVLRLKSPPKDKLLQIVQFTRHIGIDMNRKDIIELVKVECETIEKLLSELQVTVIFGVIILCKKRIRLTVLETWINSAKILISLDVLRKDQQVEISGRIHCLVNRISPKYPIVFFIPLIIVQYGEFIAPAVQKLQSELAYFRDDRIAKFSHRKQLASDVSNPENAIKREEENIQESLTKLLNDVEGFVSFFNTIKN
jgi:hypothetical protein